MPTARRAVSTKKKAGKPFKPRPMRQEKTVAWVGDAAAPPKFNGTPLAVPVERLNYRLLVIERQ